MITGGPANASLRSPHTNNRGGGGEQAQAQVAQAVGFFFPSSPILSSSPALYASQTCLGGNLHACFSELLRFRPMWKIGFPPLSVSPTQATKGYNRPPASSSAAWYVTAGLLAQGWFNCVHCCEVRSKRFSLSEPAAPISSLCSISPLYETWNSSENVKARLFSVLSMPVCFEQPNGPAPPTHVSFFKLKSCSHAGARVTGVPECSRNQVPLSSGSVLVFEVHETVMDFDNETVNNFPQTWIFCSGKQCLEPSLKGCVRTWLFF